MVIVRRYPNVYFLFFEINGRLMPAEQVQAQYAVQIKPGKVMINLVKVGESDF